METVTSWEADEKQLEALGVFYHVFLRDAAVHPATYEVCSFVKETAYVGAIICAQTQWHPALFVALLHLLQKEFN